MKTLLGIMLTKIGCKDLCLMLYGLKHFNLKLLLDGIFFGKYKYVGLDTLEKQFAKKYKNYMFSNYKQKLLKGLDCESIKTVNELEKNIKYIINYEKPYICISDFFGERDLLFSIEKYIETYTENMYFPVNHKEATVFYYKHGIYEVDNLKDYIKGKDIIDCGAFIGDSAMMFSKELGFFGKHDSIRQIFCLEPEPNNLELLKKTIKNNGMKGKIIPLGLGVGNKKEILYMNKNSSCSSVTNEGGSSIEIDTIDNIVKNYGIVPGLIKMDIEGLEYNSILGAEGVIKKYRPVLLISIYHTGKDFYEIKPLLESWNLGYKFKIRHLSTHLFFETVLICY